jgi:signal peptidase II
MLRRNLLVILSVLLIDQISKLWIKLNFTIGERINVIDGFFEIHFIENTGMAFGMEIPGEWGKIILSTFRIVAVVVISIYLLRIIREKAHRGFITCVALILAGAIGNIIDSMFYGLAFGRSSFGRVAEFMPEGGGYAGFLKGNVVDMLHFTATWPEWMPFVDRPGIEIFPPIFNVADSAITVGVFWILIRQKKYFAKDPARVANDSSAESL